MPKKVNPWLVHVKKGSTKHKGKSFKDILKLAKKSYKKSVNKNEKNSSNENRAIVGTSRI